MRRGFTLVEAMVATALTSLVITGVVSTYLMLIRNGLNLQAYAEMDAMVRRAFEQFGVDARMASAISTGSNQITLTVPNNYAATSNQVTYGYDATNQLFYLVPGDGVSSGQAYVAPGAGTVPAGERILVGGTGAAKLATKVTGVTFVRYDESSPPARTTDDSATKYVQVQLAVRRSASSGDTATDSAVSAAFTLRNKL